MKGDFSRSASHEGCFFLYAPWVIMFFLFTPLSYNVFSLYAPWGMFFSLSPLSYNVFFSFCPMRGFSVYRPIRDSISLWPNEGCIFSFKVPWWGMFFLVECSMTNVFLLWHPKREIFLLTTIQSFIHFCSKLPFRIFYPNCNCLWGLFRYRAKAKSLIRKFHNVSYYKTMIYCNIL